MTKRETYCIVGIVIVCVLALFVGSYFIYPVKANNGDVVKAEQELARMHVCHTCLIKNRSTVHRLELNFDSEGELRQFVRYLEEQALAPYRPVRKVSLRQRHDGVFVIRYEE